MGSWPRVTTSGTGGVKIASWPKIARDTAAPVTAAKTIGIAEASVQLPRMISMAKRMPPSGALNTAAMPAAVPQAAMVFTSALVSRAPRARPIPVSAPSSAMGPSGPAEAPDLIVKSESAACSPVRQLSPLKCPVVSARMTSFMPVRTRSRPSTVPKIATAITQPAIGATSASKPDSSGDIGPRTSRSKWNPSTQR